MPAAPTLWIQQGTRLRLSYELVVLNPRYNGLAPGVTTSPYGNQISRTSPPATEAAVSLRGVTLPVDRLFLVASSEGTDYILNRGLIGTGLGFGTQLGVALEACVDSFQRFDPTNPPGGLDRRCTRTLVDGSLCGSTSDRTSLLPATVLGCQIQPRQDTSYRLRVVDARDPNRPGTAVVRGTGQPPLELLPHIKVVSEPRALLRRADTTREECRVPDGAGGVRDCNATELRSLNRWRRCNQDPAQAPRGQRTRGCRPAGRGAAAFLAAQGFSPPGFADVTGLWSFSVEDLDTGAWRENFASGLTIRRIKFVHSTDAAPNRRRYLSLDPRRSVGADDLVELRGVVTDATGSRIVNQRCDIGTDQLNGDAFVDPATCPALFARAPNPAWMAGTPELPIEWRLVFRQSAQRVQVRRACEPNCTDRDFADGVLTQDLRYRPSAGDRIFLEFHME